MEWDDDQDSFEKNYCTKSEDGSVVKFVPGSIVRKRNGSTPIRYLKADPYGRAEYVYIRNDLPDPSHIGIEVTHVNNLVLVTNPEKEFKLCGNWRDRLNHYDYEQLSRQSKINIKLKEEGNNMEVDYVTLAQMTEGVRFYRVAVKGQRCVFKSNEDLKKGQLCVVQIGNNEDNFDVGEVIEEMFDYDVVNGVRYKWILVLLDKDLNRLNDMDKAFWRKIRHGEALKKAQDALDAAGIKVTDLLSGGEFKALK